MSGGPGRPGRPWETRETLFKPYRGPVRRPTLGRDRGSNRGCLTVMQGCPPPPKFKLGEFKVNKGLSEVSLGLSDPRARPAARRRSTGMKFVIFRKRFGPGLPPLPGPPWSTFVSAFPRARVMHGPLSSERGLSGSPRVPQGPSGGSVDPPKGRAMERLRVSQVPQGLFSGDGSPTFGRPYSPCPSQWRGTWSTKIHTHT